MNYTLKHPEYGDIQTAPLTQGIVNDYFEKLQERKISISELTAIQYGYQSVSVAAECGWFPGLLASEIKNLDPHKVFWMAAWIDGFLRSILFLDPNSLEPWSNTPETVKASAQPN